MHVLVPCEGSSWRCVIANAKPNAKVKLFGVAKRWSLFFYGFHIDPWYWHLQLKRWNSNTVKRTEKKERVQEFSDWRKNLRLGIFQPCLVQVLAWCNCFTKIPTSSAWEVYSLSGFLKYSFYSFTAIKPKRQWSAIEIEKEMWIRYRKRTVKNMWIARQLSRGRGINSGCRDLNAPLQSARALWN